MRRPSPLPKSRKKRKSPKWVLALPDLEHAKSAVLNTLTSKSGQRTYDHAITEFVEWYCSEPRIGLQQNCRSALQDQSRTETVRTFHHQSASRGCPKNCSNKAGRIWGDGMTPKVLWEVVRSAAASSGIEKLAPHDLRRTCAPLVSSRRRRVESDPIPAWTRFDSND